MVTTDYRHKRKLMLKYDEPIYFEGGVTYQLILPSRDLEYFAIRNVFKSCKIKKIFLDGVGESKYSQTRINASGLEKYGYHPRIEEHSRLRFDGELSGEDLDLCEIFSLIKNLKYQTLYITEIIAETPEKVILIFKSRYLSDNRIKAKIEKSLSTHLSPLWLQSIYDLETLRKIKRENFTRKSALILEGKLSKENVKIFNIKEE